MTEQEWESLCDGCGKCCLHKLQDEDTDDLLFTCIACEYLDRENCRCSVYENRKQYVPECLDLSFSDLATVSEWLPVSCAYRLLYEKKELPEWHHLVSGDCEEIHLQQMSVKGKVVSEADVPEESWFDYII